MEQMLNLLPGYYATGESRAVLDAFGHELEEFRDGIWDVVNQFFVNTATWGLEQWEKELGLSSYFGKPVAQRRSRIISKLRGVGTVTVKLIQKVAQSYDSGLVTVADHPEEGYFVIKFIDTKGIPPDWEDLKEAIEEIKPAHLEVMYEFTYLIYRELAVSGKNYAEIAALEKTYEQLKTWNSA
ncbi:putative phage tail protein [Desulfitobacterium chlororespirans]|uniref:Uncharacterized protein YmfQ in lambdoid prophage, DUF2313 family n=1 Tax=Desulfitobacterium chlororespirans DSM 11544 TaxID=1121395 RepID=A0A1M7TQX2_9FIRM|nr:putative phage tail protein [Desulfitobacterium chlororespirans]SHN73105.1 Uncharacterized protein YmfQ in lambdoid prophage, DUF2313 family [Desulfitobacterium chlororespirans DSM 11544]